MFTCPWPAWSRPDPQALLLSASVCSRCPVSKIFCSWCPGEISFLWCYTSNDGHDGGCDYPVWEFLDRLDSLKVTVVHRSVISHECFCTFTRFLLVLISFMGTSPSPRHGINHTYLFRFFFSFVSSSLRKHAPPPIQQLRATHAMQQLKFDGAYYRRPLVQMPSLPDPDASSVLLVSGLGLFWAITLI